MPKKEPSPLQLAQKEGDAVKKKVDKLLSECQTTIKKKTVDQTKHDELSQKCVEMASEISKLCGKVEILKPENEPVSIPISKFDSKKQDELKRLSSMKDQIATTSKKLSPSADRIKNSDGKKSTPADQPAADTAKGLNRDDEQEDANEDDDGDEDEEEEEDDDEGEEDEEEEEEEEEDDENEGEEEEAEEEEEVYEVEEEEEDEDESEDTVLVQYMALEDFQIQQKGDLAFKTGDILKILKLRADGWWVAENSIGEKGLVPSTLLQEYKPHEEEEEEEESEEEEDEDEAEEGQVAETPKTPRSGKELWKGVQKSVKETTVTDILQTLGSLPSGFRESTLAKKKQNDLYSMKNFLAPKLSQTCLSYQDLLLDHQTGKVRSKEVPVQRIVNIVSCQQMPLLNETLEIRSRHIRACLFDGQHVLSNIIIVRVAQVEKDQKTWNFTSKPEASCLDFAEFFIRSDLPLTNIGILFEICITYRRISTSEEAEVSCGWAFLKLYDQKLSAISNKTYEELINGGTPYEKGIDLDPNVGHKGTTNKLRTLMVANKQPRLTVRLAAPTKEQKELLDTLPDTIIGSTACIQYIALYRQILADSLLRDRHDLQSTELIHSPIATTLPHILEQPDLMDVLRGSWAEQMKITKNREKKDTDLLKSVFFKVYMKSVYPLQFLSSLSPFRITDPDIIQERDKEIQHVKRLNLEKGLNDSCLLLPGIQYKPFDTSELSFNIIGPYCNTILID